MMQAEKVAEDLRDAHEVIAGANSSVPALAGVIRRLERRAAQAPSLVEPAVKALDAALTALEETRSHLEAALRTADFDPAELERIEERLFALRAAGRKYNVAGGRSGGAGGALQRRYRADRCRRGTAQGAGGGGARGRGRLSRRGRQAVQGAREGRPPRSTRRSTASSSRSSWSGRNSRPRSKAMPPRRAERHRPGRVLGADQSGHAAGAADEGRLRRRTGALPAGAQGGAGRPRLGADAGVRRDRHRRGRRGGRRHRRAARQARRPACRCWR